jgi:hypothetical protein
VLGAVLDYGLAALEAACAEALQAGIASGDVMLTVLARLGDDPLARCYASENIGVVCVPTIAANLLVHLPSCWDAA